MGSNQLKVYKLHSDIYNFQRCVLSNFELWNKIMANESGNESKNLEYFGSILINSSSSYQNRILVKISQTQIGNEKNNNSLHCDLRVQEIFSLKTDINEIELNQRIALQVVNFLNTEDTELINRPNSSFYADLGDIKRFKKPGPIQEMTLTLVLPSIHNETEIGDFNFNNGKYTPPALKLYEEKIRDIFITYEIHLRSNSFVGLKNCPLSAAHPNEINSLFVNSIIMKNSDCDIGRVVANTKIIIVAVHDVSFYKRIIEQSQYLNSNREQVLYGLEEPYKILTDEIIFKNKMQRNYFIKRMQFSKGFLLIGPSGSGKNELVNSIVKKYCVHLETFSAASIPFVQIHNFIERIQNQFDLASKYSKKYSTILFLKDLHLLQYREKLDDGQLSISNINKKKIVNFLCQLFDSIPGDRKFIVIISTDMPHLIPLKLRRAGRIDKEIFIRVPSEINREKIIESIIFNSSQNEKFTDIELHQIAEVTPGFVGSDLARLIHLILLKSEEENSDKVSWQHVKYGLAKILPSCLKNSGILTLNFKERSLESIAGLESAKLELVKAIIWPLVHAKAFLQMGIRPSRGILLYGPPGCAKTSLVRAVASEQKTNFISVSGAELFSSAVGDSEKFIANLFHQARLASPCILFIDELESIVGSRSYSDRKGGRNKSFSENILSMLLTEMDGIEVSNSIIELKNGEANLSGPHVIVVAATNRPDLIDSALLRPGRFDRIIPIMPPNKEDRLNLLRKTTKFTPLHEDVDLEQLSNCTEFYSGADLVNLCKEAALYSIADDLNCESVKMCNFIKAKESTFPSLSKDVLKFYNEFKI